MSYDVSITTRGGGDKLKIQHTEHAIEWDHHYESQEVIIYEPATGNKETLFDFVEREMLGRYEMEWRTGKVSYKV
jgi:hypothetical protein